MKKLLSVLLAAIMIFSCCTLAVNALYLETVTEKKYVDNVKDKQAVTVYDNLAYTDIIGENGLYTQSELQTLYGVDALNKLVGDDFIEVITKVETEESEKHIENEPMLGGGYATYYYTTTKQLEVLGLSISDLYNKPNSSFLWKNLTAHPENVTPKEGEIITDISKADISLMVADINMFALRIMKSLYSDYRFYTDANAVKCINYIGKLFTPGFSVYSEGSKIFSDRDYLYSDVVGGTTVYYADESVFFQKVADYSGFSDLLQISWVEVGEARAKYRPLISLLGVPEGELLESEYDKGDKMAAAILRCAFTRIMGEGPINYFLDVFEALTKNYLTYYYTPIKYLFSQKASYISEEELRTLTGLLNLIFNDNRYLNINNYQFAPLPEARLAKTTDMSEFYLYLITYVNYNSNYLNNRNVVNNICNSIQNSAISDKATTDENGKVTAGYKTRLINVIKGICGDNIEDIFYNGIISSLTIENISSKPDEYFGNVKEALSRMVKKIADWFQMWIDIFTGKLEFGAGAFD